MINDLGIIVAAAGSSERYGEYNKLLELLCGLPLFIYCLKTFIPHCPAGQLILVVARHEKKSFTAAIEKWLPDAQIVIVEGGKQRALSIVNGLLHLPANVNYVAIHDAARPFATINLLERCLAIARLDNGAIPAKPVTDTLKQVNKAGLITATVCRQNLWRVETPQVFNLQRLREAYQLISNNNAQKNIEFTDDAAIMEAAGFSVKIVNAPEPNLKITYLEDIATAKMILMQQQNTRHAE